MDDFHRDLGKEGAEGDPEANRESVVDNFDDMGLCEDLLRGILTYGIEKPFPLHQQAILPCCQGRDASLQVQAGTQAATTVAIVTLQQLATKTGGAGAKSCQALVLTKSRETAQQVSLQWLNLSPNWNGG
ncbi:eukaryotic initiation factor 4A-II-like [Branchiostoma floridae]|uniref:ATP-dependent RNA helicase n=1 Tax=Branchiostoma floridae TaxID=7739 RepID=A0A9J7N7F9_BRAFL|nr:eukaryotic initiation factor 4A-II-like [Branchiostoma floridae]